MSLIKYPSSGGVFSILYILFVSLLFNSCSGPSEISPEKLLTSEKAAAENSNIKLAIPKGWFRTKDNKHYSADLWLIKKDYSAAISLIPVSGDIPPENGLKEAAELSRMMLGLREGQYKPETGSEKNLKLNGVLCRSYLFTDKGGARGRAVIFNYLGKYYELAGYILKKNNNLEQEKLFEIQDILLNELFTRRTS